MTIRIYIQLRTHSLANERHHWAKKARRTKEERFVVAAKVREAMRGVVYPHSMPARRPTSRDTRIAK